MTNEIIDYNKAQPANLKKICQTLMNEINSSLDGATSKLYHRNPAWFLDGNPIVAYYVPASKDHVKIMFWSGQSFDEPSLEVEGSFKAAIASYSSAEDIDIDQLNRWLEKSKVTQWDYKNIVKNRGVLNKLVG
ncbi:MAG: uncharacterized protein JWM00_475 [Candidatus Saccharibacteria bacterium]|nr:uncharacterized protein [Candidatus Saccharibacteria bacterium]